MFIKRFGKDETPNKKEKTIFVTTLLFFSIGSAKEKKSSLFTRVIQVETQGCINKKRLVCIRIAVLILVVSKKKRKKKKKKKGYFYGLRVVFCELIILEMCVQADP